MGNMISGYPRLFGAISCGVPLLDMQRYTQLAAGHSWIAEYGDPEVEEDWKFLRTFSPSTGSRTSLTRTTTIRRR